MVYPADRKENMLPAMAWLMASSSSMIGRSGERIVRVEKLRNQRLQNSKRKKIFMDGCYTYSQEILQ